MKQSLIVLEEFCGDRFGDVSELLDAWTQVPPHGIPQLVALWRLLVDGIEKILTAHFTEINNMWEHEKARVCGILKINEEHQFLIHREHPEKNDDRLPFLEDQKAEFRHRARQLLGMPAERWSELKKAELCMNVIKDCRNAYDASWIPKLHEFKEEVSKKTQVCFASGHVLF